MMAHQKLDLHEVESACEEQQQQVFTSTIFPESIKQYNDFFQSVKDFDITQEINQEHLYKHRVFYDPSKLYVQPEIRRVQQTNNHQIIALQVRLSYFKILVYILDIKQNSPLSSPAYEQFAHSKGSFGKVFIRQYNGKHVVVKSLSFKKNFDRNFKALGHYDVDYSDLQHFICQVAFLKLASALKVGPYTLYNECFDICCFLENVEFVMEYCGQQEQVQQEKYYPNELQLKENANVLHKFHIIHGDIKCQNIGQSKQYGKTVLLDFGLAKTIKQKIGEKSITCFNGSVQYVSKQMLQLLDKTKSIVGRVDLYINDKVGVERTLKNFVSFKNYDIKNGYDENVKYQEVHLLQRLKFLLYCNKLDDFYQLYQRSQSISQSFQQKVKLANFMLNQLLPTINLQNLYIRLFSDIGVEKFFDETAECLLKRLKYLLQCNNLDRFKQLYHRSRNIGQSIKVALATFILNELPPTLSLKQLYQQYFRNQDQNQGLLEDKELEKKYQEVYSKQDLLEMKPSVFEKKYKFLRLKTEQKFLFRRKIDQKIILSIERKNWLMQQFESATKALKNQAQTRKPIQSQQIKQKVHEDKKQQYDSIYKDQISSSISQYLVSRQKNQLIKFCQLFICLITDGIASAQQVSYIIEEAFNLLNYNQSNYFQMLKQIIAVCLTCCQSTFQRYQKIKKIYQFCIGYNRTYIFQHLQQQMNNTIVKLQQEYILRNLPLIDITKIKIFNSFCLIFVQYNENQKGNFTFKTSGIEQQLDNLLTQLQQLNTKTEQYQIYYVIWCFAKVYLCLISSDVQIREYLQEIRLTLNTFVAIRQYKLFGCWTFEVLLKSNKISTNLKQIDLEIVSDAFEQRMHLYERFVMANHRGNQTFFFDQANNYLMTINLQEGNLIEVQTYLKNIIRLINKWKIRDSYSSLRKKILLLCIQGKFKQVKALLNTIDKKHAKQKNWRKKIYAEFLLSLSLIYVHCLHYDPEQGISLFWKVLKENFQNQQQHRLIKYLQSLCLMCLQWDSKNLQFSTFLTKYLEFYAQKQNKITKSEHFYLLGKCQQKLRNLPKALQFFKLGSQNLRLSYKAMKRFDNYEYYCLVLYSQEKLILGKIELKGYKKKKIQMQEKRKQLINLIISTLKILEHKNAIKFLFMSDPTVNDFINTFLQFGFQDHLEQILVMFYDSLTKYARKFPTNLNLRFLREYFLLIRKCKQIEYVVDFLKFMIKMYLQFDRIYNRYTFNRSVEKNYEIILLLLHTTEHYLLKKKDCNFLSLQQLEKIIFFCSVNIFRQSALSKRSSQSILYHIICYWLTGKIQNTHKKMDKNQKKNYYRKLHYYSVICSRKTEKKKFRKKNLIKAQNKNQQMNIKFKQKLKSIAKNIKKTQKR